MALVGSGRPGIDACIHALAEGRCPVNVVDQPQLCDITTPSLVDRDPVVIAIGTEGTAPVLARQIKTRLEALLAPDLGGFAALAGRLRGAVAASVPGPRRRAFRAWAFGSTPMQSRTRGAQRDAARMLKEAIAERRAPDRTVAGTIAHVGAGPGARDLLTLRAVARLQEADVIFHDRPVDPDMLDLARRDAERVFMGKTLGARAWPQESICTVIVPKPRRAAASCG